MAGKRKTARQRLATLHEDIRGIEALFVAEGDFDFAKKLHDYAKSMPVPGADCGLFEKMSDD